MPLPARCNNNESDPHPSTDRNILEEQEDPRRMRFRSGLFLLCVAVAALTSSATTKSKEIKMKNTSHPLFEWVVNQGGRISNKIVAAEHVPATSKAGDANGDDLDGAPDWGLHLVTSRKVKQGEVLVELPDEVLMSWETAMDSSTIGNALRLGVHKYKEATDEQTQLGLALDVLTLHLRDELDKGKESFWAPYFDSLPPEADMALSFPPAWPDAVLTLLPPRTANLIEDKKFMFLRELRRLRDHLVQESPRKFNTTKFSDDRLWYPMYIVHSRSFSYHGKAALRPVLDLVNHHHEPNGKALQGELTASTSIMVGQQIFINYGALNNAKEMMAAWGFVDDITPFITYIPNGNGACAKHGINVTRTTQAEPLSNEFLTCLVRAYDLGFDIPPQGFSGLAQQHQNRVRDLILKVRDSMLSQRLPVPGVDDDSAWLNLNRPPPSFESISEIPPKVRAFIRDYNNAIDIAVDFLRKTHDKYFVEGRGGAIKHQRIRIPTPEELAEQEAEDNPQPIKHERIRIPTPEELAEQEAEDNPQPIKRQRIRIPTPEELAEQEAETEAETEGDKGEGTVHSDVDEL